MVVPAWLRRTGGAVALLAVALAVPLAGGQDAAPSDAELTAASGGRTVRVGLGPERRVTELPVEVYVARVLAGEGEPRAAGAAHEALAVAIRTYAAANRNRHQRDGYDLCDTTHCQVVRSATAASRRAAAATAGQALYYQGRAAELFYSASCGGQTEAASTVWRGMPEYPYLRPVEDHVHEGDAPWTIELSGEAIIKALRKVGVTGTEVKSISVEDRTTSGRVARLQLGGLRPADINGEDFRAAVGPTVIRSTAFSVRRVQGRFEFTGQGYGHGVGMCVIGAGRLAAQGWSATRILELYYPGLQLMAPMAVSSARPSPGASDSPAPADALRPAERPVPVTVTGEGAAASRSAIEAAVRETYLYLSSTLGVTSAAPLTMRVYADVAAFRQATGQPWWVSHHVNGGTVDVQPPALLAQREGVAASVRVALADLVLRHQLGDRPEWVRVGAARYHAQLATGGAPAASTDVRLRCPADEELLLPLSAPSHREAEWRAEVCYARARPQARDWRSVR